MTFNKGEGIVVSDVFRQARLSLNPAPSNVPDALDKSVNASWLKKTLKESGDPTIKELLVNQKVIRGIGNAYADEILYSANISPFSNPQKIPGEHVDKLSAEIRKVLRWAISRIKKSNPAHVSGELRDFLRVSFT